MSERLHGVGVSPGVAVGRVLLLTRQALPVVPTPIPPERVEEEIERFEQARQAARVELLAVRDRIREALGEHYASILEAQLLIVDDARLVAETTQRIRVGRVAAEWALKEVIGGLMRTFETIEDDYLRQRGGDLDDLHQRLQRQLRGGPAPRAGRHLEGPLVVVAHALGPSDAMALAEREVRGLATDVGGPTSHTAILAQALGVPAVVGLRDLSLKAMSGDAIVLDGETGEVELAPGPEAIEAARAKQAEWERRESAMAADSALPVVTADGVEITLRANIEFPQEAELALRFGARGIGLYRSEFLFLSRSPEFPSEDEHYRTYREIGERVAPHPAVIRTLDLGGEKYFHTVLHGDEANPVLGLRGIRLCLQRPDIFRPQLRGLLRAAVHADLRLMIPLVIEPGEVREVRRLLAAEARGLAAEGREARADVPVGIMVEVPAAAMTADLLAREVDFFSLGTNDLIQYALAVDRNNESVDYLYKPDHPAILRTLRFVIRSANAAGTPVAVCGEMAADPRLTAILIGLGLRELSVQPRALGAIRRAIRGCTLSESERIAERALDRDGSAGLRDEPVIGRGER